MQLVIEGGEEKLRPYALLVEVEWSIFIANTVKTVGDGSEEKLGFPTDPTKEPPKKIRRGFRGKN